MSPVTLLALLSGVTFIAYGILCLFTDSMKDEFERFGLAQFRVMTGALEVLGGTGLLVGLWWPPATLMASAGLTALMVLGLGVRLKVGDTLTQALPALILMLVNGYILVENWPTSDTFTAWTVPALVTIWLVRRHPKEGVPTS